ncbi:MAG: glutaminase [Pseudomonadota bacterium]
MQDLQHLVDDIAAEMAARTDRGQVADYIPELAKVDPNQFGLAIALADGSVVSAGDAQTPFSIQSISKVFTLTLALGRLGDALWRRVGREPSGDPFNSIVQLEADNGIPRNPLINAGALVVTDVLLAGHKPREVIGEILDFMRLVTGDDEIRIDPDVAKSEERTGFRNAALANFMRAAGNIHHPPALTLGVYFHHCAIAMTCRQLALAGRYLAFGGCIGPDGDRIVPPARARRLNAIMLTCGHYDGSGDFAFRVGLPGKSGVGGGILAIAPGVASIAAWSPGLNDTGNSQLAARALKRLTDETGWSIFGSD